MKTFATARIDSERQTVSHTGYRSNGNDGEGSSPASHDESEDIFIISPCCGGPIVVWSAREQQGFRHGQMIVLAAAFAILPFLALLTWKF